MNSRSVDLTLMAVKGNAAQLGHDIGPPEWELNGRVGIVRCRNSGCNGAYIASSTPLEDYLVTARSSITGPCPEAKQLTPKEMMEVMTPISRAVSADAQVLADVVSRLVITSGEVVAGDERVSPADSS